MNNKYFLLTLGCVALSMATQAADVTFDFQVSPPNQDVGTHTNVTEGGITITASGFDTSGNPSDLFSKFTDGDTTETGLGMAVDTFGGDETEIDSTHFIQLDFSSVQNTPSCVITISSIQSPEGANVWATTAPGSIGGATLVANLPGSAGVVQSVDVTSYVNAGNFIDIQASAGNVLIETVAVTPPPQTPSLLLTKTASATSVAPGQPVTYFYCVTNSGNMEVDNINIVDDNGTPADPSDDFTVNAAPFNLLPGQTACFSIPHITEPLCMPYGGSNLFIGNLTINVLVNGDVEVLFVQPQSLNDNRYGTGATAATGWPGGHKFGDLTGSDECTFQFNDGLGNAVLSFQEDYISAATSVKFGNGVTITYPSGYGTLGPLGGDGKMITGSSSNVLSCRTSLSDTINQSSTFYGFTVNSPPETAPLSGVSIPAGWDYVNSYYVKVSHFAFGANGFGGVTIPFIHDSPSKIQGIIKFFPTNMCNCVTNVAVASGVSVTGGSTVTDDDFEIVCASTGSNSGGGGGACSLVAGALKFDKNTIQIPIKDNGSANIVMNTLTLGGWPSVNGRLKTVTLNGTAYGGAAAPLLGPAPPTVIIGTGGVSWTGNTGSRTINKGQSKTLILTFEKNVSTNKALYSGWSASFGSDASCNLTIFP